MPASTLDPVNAAIRSSLAKTASETNLDVQLAGATKKALLADIEFEAAGSYQTSVLDKLKTKYIVLKTPDTQQTSNSTEKMGADETLTLAKHALYPLEAVQLGWSNTEWVVGAGMVNMGNTCYLNSTLQALFHVPALVNWLVSDKQHMSQCEDSGGLCIICAMRKTLQDSQQRNTNSIRPFLIYNKLRVVCRNLIPGRQEDAHEFLRYLVEAMEKAYLRRFKNYSEFDSRTKETTPLNQILGGYLRSAVRCLECGHVSTTFQHFQDLLLDIRKAQTLEEALDGYFSREKLDDESYHCESCQKKVPATKQFSLERAPMVLCIQLKRFSVSNNKITKHVQFRSGLELTKYARHRTSVPLIYRFVALVTHMGPTVGCGHYTAVAQAPCGNYYQFDDSMVRPISHQAVFSTNAYIMLYELECPPFAQKTQNNGSASATTSSSSSTSCSAAGKIKATLSTSNSNNNSSNSLTVHNSKDQQQQQPERNKPSSLSYNTKDNNNNSSSSSSSGGKSQAVNGSAKAPVYGPELPPNLSALIALSTNAITTETTSPTSCSSSSSSSSPTSTEQNGVVSSSDHDKKMNVSTTTTTEQQQQPQHHHQVHQRLVGKPSTSSTTNDDDHDSKRQQQQHHHHRQNTKQEQRQAILPALIGNRNHRSVRQNGESIASSSSASTSSPSTTTTTALSNTNVTSVSAYKSSPLSGYSNDLGAGKSPSPTRSGSSSSVSSLSSNVDRGGSNSPKVAAATTATDSPKTATSTRTTSATKLLVPYDVDDDDDDVDDDEEEDGDDGGKNIRRRDQELDGEEGCNSNSSSNGSGSSNGTTTVTATVLASTEEDRVPTKATTADWQVTSSADRSAQMPSSEGRSWNKKNKNSFQKENTNESSPAISTSFNSSGATTVTELLKMSHVGYSTPVSSWNGTRAALDKEVNEERREERKRTLCDNTDRGRVKHIKTNYSFSSSNPGYNRLQEFHNAKNSWNQNNNIGSGGGGSGSSPSPSSSCYSSGGGSNSSRQFYNTSGKHRNRRNNFHHKGGGSNNYHHKNNYVYRQ